MCSSLGRCLRDTVDVQLCRKLSTQIESVNPRPVPEWKFVEKGANGNSSSYEVDHRLDVFNRTLTNEMTGVCSRSLSLSQGSAKGKKEKSLERV